MQYSRTFQFSHLLFWAVLTLTPAIAGSDNTELPVSTLPVSQVSVTARVTTAAIQEKLRLSLAGMVSSKWQQTQRKLDLGVLGSVGAVIRFQPRVSELSFSADARGRLQVVMPIRVRPEPNSSGLASLGVKKDGCGQKIFDLSVVFAPKISGESLTFIQKDPTASSDGYRCIIGPNTGGKILTFGLVTAVDVASQIRAEIESRAKVLFESSTGHIEDLLTDNGNLSRMASQPVEFGSGVRLGIEVQSFRPLRLYGDGRLLNLDGVVEGYPWLEFGQKPAHTSLPGAGSAAQGFHLPAVLLFPTDPALLPVTGPEPVRAMKAGGFGLRPVPGRDDLVVLQRQGEKARENVIWLSGSAERHGRKDLRFEQPMTGVLDQILDWLNQAQLWRDVPGVADLKTEVAAFRQVVEQLQQETSLPLDARGTLHFSQLSLDLISVRVSEEAIWADVVLRGQARLDISWPL